MGVEYPLKHSRPNRLSRTVARLLIMADSVYRYEWPGVKTYKWVKTVHNVFWLACMLGLTSPDNQVSLISKN